jgi:hypothetical protein
MVTKWENDSQSLITNGVEYNIIVFKFVYNQTLNIYNTRCGMRVLYISKI